MPIYILDDTMAGHWKPGVSSRWWLHHSLHALHTQLDHKLNVYHGDARTIITQLLGRYPIAGFYYNRCYEPWYIKHDRLIETILKKKEIPYQGFDSATLWVPGSILTKKNSSYKVYTPFYRAAINTQPIRTPYNKPKKMRLITDAKNRTRIASLKLITDDTTQHLDQFWQVGEDAAKKRLHTFTKKNLVGYKKNRNFPAQYSTSRLSAHIHFGELSPQYIWHYLQKKRNAKNSRDIDFFLSELGWRDFFYQLLFFYPDLPRKNFRQSFDRFAWKTDKSLLTAWQRGRTGYPFVDAGMRELAQTGFMHNRVRMIVASFLTKNLMIDWRTGQDWFWKYLVDADLANNSANWQWVAGSGADAAPYFRIFNPITQAKKFDPTGDYIREFIPELKQLPNKYIHAPWRASDTILATAQVHLGKTYPYPIVELDTTRKRALSAYKKLKK